MAEGDWWDLGANISRGWKDITGVTAQEQAAGFAEQYGNQAITEQRNQFGAFRDMMNPYAEAGANSLEQQQALSGALGPEAQQAAYNAIQNSAGFQSQVQQGENSILQNASATGGLRGGNTQGALAQFSPQMLSQAIDQRYGQLGGLTNMGMSAAGSIGSAGMAMGNNVSNLMTGIGDAQAAAALGSYNTQRQAVGDVVNFGKDAISFGAKQGWF